MQAHKITLLVIDHDGIGTESIRIELENANYGNDCISPTVKATATVDIGEWTDDHPLNRAATAEAEYSRLFPAEVSCAEPDTTLAKKSTTRVGVMVYDSVDDLPTCFVWTDLGNGDYENQYGHIAEIRGKTNEDSK